MGSQGYPVNLNLIFGFRCSFAHYIDGLASAVDRFDATYRTTTELSNTLRLITKQGHLE